MYIYLFMLYAFFITSIWFLIVMLLLYRNIIAGPFQSAFIMVFNLVFIIGTYGRSRLILFIIVFMAAKPPHRMVLLWYLLYGIYGGAAASLYLLSYLASYYMAS